MSENNNVTALNKLKNWFKTGLKPTQAQFWAWLDSFWHKDEEIPQEKIIGLAETLENKAETSDLEAKANADATGLSEDNIISWKEALGVGALPTNIATVDQDNEVGNVYTKTKTNELLQGKLAKPTTEATTTEAPFVVGVNSDNESYKLPAGDLGKNIGNTDMQIPAGEVRTLDTTGAILQIKGKSNANNDASYTRRLVENSQGEQRYMDANVMMKSDFIHAIDLLSPKEKTEWMKKWTGQYSNNPPIIKAIKMPVVKKSESTGEFIIYGTNLYFDPANAEIRYRAKSNPNSWHNVLTWYNIDSNRINVVIDMDNTEVGQEYIFELRHQSYIVNSNTGVLVVEDFETADLSNVSWINVKKDYADSLLTSTREGNVISHYNVSRQGTTGTNQDGKLASVWKSSTLIPHNRDGIITLSFNIEYISGNWDFPITFDAFGVAAITDGEESIENITTTFLAKVMTGYQNYKGSNPLTGLPGAGNAIGNSGIAIFIKRGLSVQAIVQVEGHILTANSKLLTNIDIGVMLQLNGRYLGATKIGDYSIKEVYLI